MTPVHGARDVSERRWIALGATLTVFGIATSTGELASLASVLTLGGLLLSIVGLHRFGRTGPDQPVARALESRRVKTKPKRARQARSARGEP